MFLPGPFHTHILFLPLPTNSRLPLPPSTSGELLLHLMHKSFMCIMKVVLKKYPLRSCLISKILYTKVMRVSLWNSKLESSLLASVSGLDGSTSLRPGGRFQNPTWLIHPVRSYLFTLTRFILMRCYRWQKIFHAMHMICKMMLILASIFFEVNLFT